MEKQNGRGSNDPNEVKGTGRQGTTGAAGGATGDTTRGASGSTGSTGSATGGATRGTTGSTASGISGSKTRDTNVGTTSAGRRTSSFNEDGENSSGGNSNKILTAIGAVLGGALLYKGAKALTGSGKKALGANTVITATNRVVVKRPKEELYAYWRNLENLPNFMSHLEEINEIDDTTSEWSAEIPGGLGTIEWEAEIIREETDHLIVWRSLPGSEIENSGEVRFEDAMRGKGTIVESTISYRPPAGKVGGLAAKLLNPAFQSVVENDLKEFKKLMEKGGKAKRRSSPAGRM